MNLPALGPRSDPLRNLAAGAAIACLVGVVLAGSGPLRPLGLLLCAGAAAAFLWTAWRLPYWRIAAEPETSAPSGEPEPEQMSAVLEAMPDPTLLIDRHGRIASANAGARRMLGFATAGLRLSAVLRRPELLDAADAAVHDGAALAVDYEIAAPVEEHFRVFVAPVHLERGNAALMVFHDQTNAINTDRMRADFLANASHEIRTPLASLTLLLETLTGHAKNDPVAQERFLKMMHVQADRMRELIDDLLSLSKIELNEHVPPSDEVDLAPLVRAMIEKLTPLAQGRKVTLSLSAEAPEMKVIGDRSQLSQVAQNLLDNAIKYSPEGGKVEIALGLGEDREEAARRAGRQWDDASRISLLSPPPAVGRRYVFMRVSDSGAGIARRYLPRLSERFYRVERDEGTEQVGTGLGLAIVKHIVNRHHGGFIVESEPGRGSAFAVYLERPAAAVEQVPQGGSAAPAVSS
jgi:two-component system phosphate regulon sensor histidine kinase PhoR